jgi:hypothetical protein
MSISVFPNILMVPRGGTKQSIFGHLLQSKLRPVRSLNIRILEQRGDALGHERLSSE